MPVEYKGSDMPVNVALLHRRSRTRHYYKSSIGDLGDSVCNLGTLEEQDVGWKEEGCDQMTTWSEQDSKSRQGQSRVASMLPKKLCSRFPAEVVYVYTMNR